MAWACDPLDDGAQCLKGVAGDIKLRGEKRHARIRKDACAACATFGGVALASHLRFSDAVVADDHVRIRTGVAIDRDLGRAADQKLFDFEAGPPGARFVLRVHCDNTLEWQVGLLLLAIDGINDGRVRIGGFGSRGLGRFERKALRVATTPWGGTGTTDLDAAGITRLQCEIRALREEA